MKVRKILDTIGVGPPPPRPTTDIVSGLDPLINDNNNNNLYQKSNRYKKESSFFAIPDSFKNNLDRSYEL